MRPDCAAIVQHDIHRQGVGRTFNNRIRVLPELSRGSMRELSFCPGSRIHRHIKQHLAVVSRAQISHSHNSELANNSERNHASRILSDTKALGLLVLVEEVC